jgi:hypothetical protein
MNTISTVEFKRPTWETAIILALGFWLSSSLVLDWVIMPSLYLSGMMSQTDFTMAGYAMFWNFNRMELLSASVVLTGVLALSQAKSRWNPRVIVFALMLLAVTLVDTYFLTPQMCAVGINLNLFATTATIPGEMNVLHSGYFVLEILKVLAAGTLLKWCWQQQV